MKREIILSGAEKGYALSWSAFTRASRAITYPEELQTVVSATQIYGSDGRLKGISYTVCAEDYTDANFSDFCLNVVAWVK